MKHDGLKIDLRDEPTWPVADAAYSSALENFREKRQVFPIYEKDTNLDDKVSTYCIHWQSSSEDVWYRDLHR